MTGVYVTFSSPPILLAGFGLDERLLQNTVLFIITLFLFALLVLEFSKSLVEMIREMSSSYMGTGGAAGVIGGVLGILIFTNATTIMERFADMAGINTFADNYITQLVTFTPDDMISFFVWIGAVMLWASGLIVGIPGFISAFDVYAPGMSARLPSSVMKVLITSVFILSLMSIVQMSGMPPLPSLLIQLFS